MFIKQGAVWLLYPRWYRTETNRFFSKFLDHAVILWETPNSRICFLRARLLNEAMEECLDNNYETYWACIVLQRFSFRLQNTRISPTPWQSFINCVFTDDIVWPSSYFRSHHSEILGSWPSFIDHRIITSISRAGHDPSQLTNGRTWSCENWSSYL